MKLKKNQIKQMIQKQIINILSQDFILPPNKQYNDEQLKFLYNKSFDKLIKNIKSIYKTLPDKFEPQSFKNKPNIYIIRQLNQILLLSQQLYKNLLNFKNYDI